MLVAFSTMVRDLKNLQQLAASVHEFATEWLGDGSMTGSARGVSPGDASCASNGLARFDSVDEFRWSGRIAPGKAIEIKGINGDISAEPATGGEVEVIANKKGRHSDPGAVKIQVVEHPGGVTICAIYPSDDSDQSNTCEPGEETTPHNSSATINVRNNDVRVDFAVRIPANVELIGRTINGGINARSLNGNVKARTVNGSVDMSTTGYGQAKTVNGEISVRLGDAAWPGPLEFKTVNGGINLDLPSSLSTEIAAETFNGEISSDFPLTLLGSFSRKHLKGTIGSGGRELILKTLNGSIHLRRAS